MLATPMALVESARDCTAWMPVKVSRWLVLESGRVDEALDVPSILKENLSVWSVILKKALFVSKSGRVRSAVPRPLMVTSGRPACRNGWVANEELIVTCGRAMNRQNRKDHIMNFSELKKASQCTDRGQSAIGSRPF
jgi:hypothetical protein